MLFRIVYPNEYQAYEMTIRTKAQDLIASNKTGLPVNGMPQFMIKLKSFTSVGGTSPVVGTPERSIKLDENDEHKNDENVPVTPQTKSTNNVKNDKDGHSPTDAIPSIPDLSTGLSSLSLTSDSKSDGQTSDINIADEIYENSQRKRKVFILTNSVLFIIAGIVIIVSFVSFIKNDYQTKCINPNGKWLNKHSELRYYQEYCTKKSIRMFNNYPCNCRVFEAFSIDFNQFNQTQFEASVEHFDNLQAVSVFLNTTQSEISTSPSTTFNFTRNMVRNLVYLNVIVLKSIDIGYIDEAISYANNLEIFIMHDNLVPFYLPLSNMTNGIKALSIRVVPHITNTKINESLCDFTQLKYFEINYGPAIDYFPFECVSQKLKNLRYLAIKLMPLMEVEIDVNFWLLPQLKTVILEHDAFLKSSFNYNNFLGYSNSLVKVSLWDNDDICQGNITINNTNYNGFGFLDDNSTNFSNNNDNNNNHKNNGLDSFIAQFNPCESICDVKGENDYFSCAPSFYKDGICQQECNVQFCNYDGGDCNQLCDSQLCPTNLWFNDVCDSSEYSGCNTTDCAFDFYTCISRSNNDTCFIGFDEDDDFNFTDSEIEICYQVWTEDSWCDLNCNNTECGFDNGACDTSSCLGYCERVHDVIRIGGAFEPPYELITVDELCDNFEFAQTYFGFANGTCQQVFSEADLNNNSVVGMYELLVASADAWLLTTVPHFNEKLEQIDCSHCLDNQTLYYA